jgi:hypothetical protein
MNNPFDNPFNNPDSFTPMDLVRHMLTAGTPGEWALFVPLCALILFCVVSVVGPIVQDVYVAIRTWRRCRRDCGAGEFAIYMCTRKRCPGTAAADANRAQFV